MKITINPMPGLKAAKIIRVNENFNNIALGSLNREQAHAQKRVWAGTNDTRLKPEADLRGISVDALAEIILSKPDTATDRELHRQTIMLRIEAAQTPEELNAI